MDMSVIHPIQPSIEMRNIATTIISESSEGEAKKLSDYTNAEKLSLLIPGVSIAVTVVVAVLMMTKFKGESGLIVCRIYALYSIVFLILTFGRMFWNVFKIQRSGHFRLAGASHVSRTIKLFIYFMTLATVVGYYNRFSYMRIFWNYDFVLNYTNRNLELPIDVFCVTVLIIYLLFQAYYVIIVAPRIGVTIVEKSLFGTTLFLNAFQKWLLETLLVQSDICEEKIYDTRCQTFVKYQTSRANLSDHQRDLYVDVESGASFTYTCNLELFIGILALLLYLPAPLHRSALQMMLASGAALISVNNPTSPLKHHFPKWITGILWGKHGSEQSQEEISEPAIIPTHWCLRAIFYVYCLFLGFLPLYIIYVIPIIQVNDNLTNEIFNLSIARLIFHIGLFAFLAFFNFYVYRNCKLQPILEEPDLIILVIASCIIALKLFALIIFEIAVDIFTERKIEKIDAIVISSITTIFEILSFFIFIHFTQKFFHLGHKSLSESDKRWLSMFPTSFLALYFLYYGIIGFAMYYLLNRLQIPFATTNSEDLDNALSIMHSLYPTTTLFSMTMTLCFGHIIEKFHDARLYDFKKQKDDLQGSAQEVKEKLGQY